MTIDLAGLIDPRLAAHVAATREFYRTRGAGRGPRDRGELQSVRDAARAPAPSHPPAGVEVVRHGDRTVPVRIHGPHSASPRGVVLDIHGGGFYIGSAASGDVRNRELADRLDVAVVSVDYRLAPENPWPAAPDDCETAAPWLVAHAAERFGTQRLALSGFSAGATLAMTTLVRLRDRGMASFDGAALRPCDPDGHGRARRPSHLAPRDARPRMTLRRRPQ